MMFGSGQRPHVDKALLAAKAEELTRTIRQLGALKNGLDHAASCPAPNHMDCPSFQRLMKIAATRIGRSRSRLVRTRGLITSA
ncbi:MAG: hypothetical protein ACSLE1_19290 [Sphingobium sp.]